MLAAVERPDVVRRNDVTVKIDAKLSHMAKIVAAHKDVSLAEYLTSVLWPIVERDLKEYSRKALGDEKPKEPKK